MFARGLPKNFQYFGFDYWLMIGVLIFSLAFIISLRDVIRQSPKEKWIRYVGGTLLICGLISEQLWELYERNYSLSNSLPLSLCSISAMFAAWTLFRKDHFTFDIVFFTGIGGALAALLMADIKYDFPHITFINYYEKHILVVLAPVYMMIVHGFYPTIRSYKRMILTLLALLPFVLALDLSVDGNYWYLVNPPHNHQSVNFFSDFPYRTIQIVILASIFSFGMLIPFQFFQKVKRQLSH